MPTEKTLDDLIAGMRETNREADQITGLIADSFVHKLLLQGYMRALQLADVKCQESMRVLANQLNGNGRVSFADRGSGHLDRGEDKYPDDMQLPRMMNRAEG